MEKTILSIYERKSHPTINTQYLLNKDEKISIPLLREKLYKIDLADKLVLILDNEISKVLKPDYSFNDHGIYYSLNYSSNHDQVCHDQEKVIDRLKTKLKSWSAKGKVTDTLELEILEACENLALRENQVCCIIVPLEESTQKRDYDRFLNYDSFVDPVFSIGKSVSLPIADKYILDIETTGLSFDDSELTHIGVKPVGMDTVVIVHNPTKDRVKYLLKELEGKTVILHNAVFDLSWLMHKAGLEFIPDFEVIDTMLLAHVAGERQISLKHLSMMYGNFLGRRNTMSADDDYLIEDLLSTECLYNKFKDVYNTFAGKLVCNATKTFSEVRVAGVHLNSDRLFEIRDSYTYLDKPKYAFNVNSNRELAKYFIEQGVKFTEKTEKGDWKVDQKTLERIKHPAIEEYLEYNKELQIYHKFLKPYCEMQNFNLRPEIMLFGTETGRLSCKNPNVQQIPNRSEFKDIFSSRFKDEGFIATIDLDQAELRVAALLSGDKIYSKALLSNDFHKLVASKTFEKPESEVNKQERFTAKSVNFGGVLYGGSAKGIAFRINVATALVVKVQEWYKREFVQLTNWIEETKQLALRTSQIITFFGRKRLLNDLRYDQKLRIGVNTAVQSVASDVMLFIVVRLSSLLRQNKLKSKIMFPVHDELLLDIYKPELEKVIELLQQAFKDVLKTPIGKLELSKTLPISGSLEWANSWLYLKNENYPALGSRKISSLG